MLNNLFDLILETFYCVYVIGVDHLVLAYTALCA